MSETAFRLISETAFGKCPCPGPSASRKPPASLRWLLLLISEGALLLISEAAPLLLISEAALLLILDY
jgi:hypothetical protein